VPRRRHSPALAGRAGCRWCEIPSSHPMAPGFLIPTDAGRESRGKQCERGFSHQRASSLPRFVLHFSAFVLFFAAFDPRRAFLIRQFIFCSFAAYIGMLQESAERERRGRSLTLRGLLDEPPRTSRSPSPRWSVGRQPRERTSGACCSTRYQRPRESRRSRRYRSITSALRKLCASAIREASTKKPAAAPGRQSSFTCETITQ